MPHVSGGDVAGTVIAVGSAADGWSAGDRVLVDPDVVLPSGSHGALGETGGRGCRGQLTNAPVAVAHRRDALS